jgi:hypothetical protein
MAKLITRNIFTPLLPPHFGWCAFLEGEEDENAYGWGTTEAEAIADWKRLQCEAEEASYDLDATLARINEAINEE